MTRRASRWSARCATRSGRPSPLRVDANGAWDVDTAVAMITRLARYDLEYVEQPVATLDDLARVRRRVEVPVAADECIRTVDDARRLRALDAADVIVLKQQPLGGVRAALAVAEAAGRPGGGELDARDVGRHRGRGRARGRAPRAAVRVRVGDPRRTPG